TRPLRIASHLGMYTALVAVLYLLVVVIEKIFWGIDIPGYATMIVVTLLLGGIQLLCIGIIGEYVGRTFEQTKDRPIYIAKHIYDYKEEQ
ncbi:MAG: glycosyltransferase, partial [Clostridia bacterium]|nr:glycosyltransferase [Clostridia bacterium]